MAENENAEEVTYTKSTAQVDLETRLANDNATSANAKVLNPGYGDVESGHLYLGTNPEYQNHANDTEAPYQADGGPDEAAEQSALGAYDSRQVKEDAANLDENERLDPQEGVSPEASVKSNDGSGSPLVVESPPTGEVPDNEEYEDGDSPAPSAGFTGGTGNASPSAPTPPPGA